jgi:hypothetical protein
MQLAIASQVGGITLVTTSHTAQTSPTFASHVGDSSPTSASHVGDSSSTSASHVEGLSPTSASHVGHSSPTSTSHVGDFLLASAIHAGSMSLTTASHAGGIHTIEKPKCVRRKPKFLCRFCKGDHLTRLCPANVVVQEVWSMPGGPLGSKLSLVSQPSLVDTTIVSMQSSANTTPIFGGDVSLDLVVSHPVQPVVMSMQSSVDTAPIFGSDESLDLVVSHPIQPTIEEEVVSMQYSIDPTLLLESDKPNEVTLSMQSSVNPTLILEGDASSTMSLAFLVLYLLN